MLYLAGQIAIILLPVALVFFGLGFWSRGFLRKPEPAAATSTALREELRRQDADKPELRTPVVSKVVLPEIGEEVPEAEGAPPVETVPEKPEVEVQEDAPVAEPEDDARGGGEEETPDPLKEEAFAGVRLTMDLVYDVRPSTTLGFDLTGNLNVEDRSDYSVDTTGSLHPHVHFL